MTAMSCGHVDDSAFVSTDTEIASSDARLVYVGAFVRSVWPGESTSGLSYLDLYLWFRWKQTEELCEDWDVLRETVVDWDLLNHLHDDFWRQEHDAASTETLGDGWCRAGLRVSGSFRHDINLRAYPFDVQHVTLIIEEDEHDAAEVRFVPENTVGQLVASNALRSGWSLGDVRWIGPVEMSYDTRFGLGNKAPKRYSRLVLDIAVQRAFLPFFLKFMLPMSIIVATSFLVFFIEHEKFDVQIALSVGALVSAVIFYLSMAAALPDVGYITSSDMYFLGCYGFISFTLAQTVACNLLVNTNRRMAADRLDQACGRIILPLYPVFVLIFVLAHV